MSASASARYEMIIAGKESPSRAGSEETLLNPATNDPLATVATGGREDARAAMEAAEEAFQHTDWRSDDGSRRAKALSRLAQRLEEQLDGFAELESLNQGKPLREARADILYVVRTLEYTAGLADKIEGESIPVPGPRLDYTLREPLGVTVHIAPWNYPLLLAMRSVAPALAAGNAVVLKPASLTPLTALRLARLAVESGVPPGIFNVVVGSGREVGEALLSDPRCASASFTGSLEVGRRIAELAAARMIPLNLELGGKGPVLIFPDADLDRAVRGVGWGIFGNAGQMCWAGSRLLVHDSVREPFLARLRAFAEKIRVGPGTSEGAEMGPLVSRDQHQRVSGFVSGATSEGATLLTGGTRYPDGPLARGNFMPPTIVEAVRREMPILREEVFGPVLTVQSFSSTEEALSLANDTPFGLLASVWTRDLATAHQLARQLASGMVTVNDPPATFPQSPFGGYKASGLGFEQGVRAVELYTRRKNVLLNIGLPKTKG